VGSGGNIKKKWGKKKPKSNPAKTGLLPKGSVGDKKTKVQKKKKKKAGEKNFKKKWGRRGEIGML